MAEGTAKRLRKERCINPLVENDPLTPPSTSLASGGSGGIKGAGVSMSTIGWRDVYLGAVTVRQIWRPLAAQLMFLEKLIVRY